MIERKHDSEEGFLHKEPRSMAYDWLHSEYIIIQTIRDRTFPYRFRLSVCQICMQISFKVYIRGLAYANSQSQGWGDILFIRVIDCKISYAHSLRIWRNRFHYILRESFPYEYRLQLSFGPNSLCSVEFNNPLIYNWKIIGSTLEKQKYTG